MHSMQGLHHVLIGHRFSLAVVTWVVKAIHNDKVYSIVTTQLHVAQIFLLFECVYPAGQ